MNHTSASKDIKRKLEEAGWGDLEEVAASSEGINPKRRFKRSKKQLRLRREKQGTTESAFTGTIQVFPFSSIILDLKLDRDVFIDDGKQALLSGTKGKTRLKSIPVRFKSTQEYAETFLPLVITECKEQIKRDVNSPDWSPKCFSCRVSQVLPITEQNLGAEHIYKVFDIHSPFSNSSRCVEKIQIKIILKRIEGMTERQAKREEKSFMLNKLEYIRKNIHVAGKAQRKASLDSMVHARGQLLLFSKVRSIVGSYNDILKLQRHGFYSLGLVDKSHMPIFSIINDKDNRSRISGFEIAYRTDAIVLRSSKLKPGWLGFCLSVSNVITSWREYDAVASCISRKETSKIKSELIKAVPAPEKSNNKVQAVLSSKLLDYFRKKFNKSQLNACLQALNDGNGFTLIQGPPGTGKTSTLLGILNLYHMAVSRMYKNSILSRFLRTDFHEETLHSIYPFPTILVCAPSNTALNGIANRILQNQFYDNSLGKYLPRMVRCGSKCEKESARKIALDLLVQRELEGNSKELILKLSQKKRDLRKIMNVIRLKKKQNEDYQKYEREVMRLVTSITSLSRRKNILYKSGSKMEKERLMRELIIEEAQIVFTTLNSSALTEIRQSKKKIEVVVVDEAAQAVEPSVLIPLQYNSERCILIGDPIQLPPTVFSLEAIKCGYEMSLFERLQANSYPSYLLETQYRSHPTISAFISSQFYSNRLKDGENVMDRKYVIPCLKNPDLGPLVFYNITDSHTRRSDGFSFYNDKEAKVVQNLYIQIRQTLSCAKVGIGVITPYSAQLKLLRQQLKVEKLNDSCLELNTIDGYQGREHDVIILSLVRTTSESEDGPSLGFLQSQRRLNVALSRAKYSLLVLGDRKLLEKSRLWKNFLSYVEKRGRIVQM